MYDRSFLSKKRVWYQEESYIWKQIFKKNCWKTVRFEKQGQVGQRCVLFEWMFFMNDCFLWMNAIYEWMKNSLNELVDECFFCWVRTTFLLKKCMNSMSLMNALPDQPTDRQTDKACYRDARTHLKTFIRFFLIKSTAKKYLI